MPHGKPREVIQEPSFTRELHRLIKDAKRADEFIDGVVWLLARSPRQGRQISNSHVWYAPMKQKVGILPIVIYYTFDDDFVNLMSIQETLYAPE